MARQITQLRQKIDSQTNLGAGGAVRQEQEPKLHAVIGNLGWDTDASDLEARARALLTECGIAEGSFKHLASTRRQGGSMVELWFNEAKVLDEACLAIKGAKKTFAQWRFRWYFIFFSFSVLVKGIRKSCFFLGF